mmetsp:Transcript_17481/g.40639  ORF Transcript_17481/g.40639 Transcript_17481/m.40639 type:complete len:147 (-) Transcript_17481:337-777(-)
MLGAKHVTLTDLACCIPLMKENVKRNDLEKRVSCRECDWFHPSQVEKESFCCDVLLVADCIWIESLVEPLLNTISRICCVHGSGGRLTNYHPVVVIVSYQRRGKVAHERFWKGMHAMFPHIDKMKVENIPNDGAPRYLNVFVCQSS